MLAPTVDGRFCAWLRARRARKGAALLTRVALRGLQGVSGRGASRHIDAKASNKGLAKATEGKRPPGAPPLRREAAKKEKAVDPTGPST